MHHRKKTKILSVLLSLLIVFGNVPTCQCSCAMGKVEDGVSFNLYKNQNPSALFANRPRAGKFVAFIRNFADIVIYLGFFSRGIIEISQLRWASRNFINMYKETTALFKSPPKETSKKEILERLDLIFKNFYGQQNATQTLKSHLFDIAVAKDMAKWSGKRYSQCDLLYLYGPSGVGKSFIAKQLPFVLLNNGTPFILSSADVNIEKNESVVDQLFTPKAATSQTVSFHKPLVEYLKNNPGGVVVLEEYDKFCTRALDEVLRGMIDNGILNIDGEKINCNGTTFIATSNEDEVSLSGYDENSSTTLTANDLQKGYTRIHHSKSFLNRIKKVKFDDLLEFDYSRIIKNHFNTIKSYWNNDDYGKINLNIDKNIVAMLSKAVKNKNQGARPIDLWVIPEIQVAIGNKIKSAPFYNFYSGKNLNVTYNESDKTVFVDE